VPTPEPTPTPTPAPTPGKSIKVSGRVSSASGVCPILLFSVQDRDVFTLPGTGYSKGNCQDVQNRAEVEVEGVQMSDGTVRADKVTIKKKAPGLDGL
jgi:hypothetical protein